MSRKQIPNWPPFKKSYRHLGSTEHVPLESIAQAPGSTLSAGATFTPTLPSAVAYTPEPLLHSPTRIKPVQKTTWIGHGWRGGARIALLSVVTVFIVNLAILIGIVTRGTSMRNGIYMVYQGRCEDTERKNSWVHLTINIVATLLLAGSNYCMQLLSSPTRSEIDNAHSQRKWLDIGIPSLRNLGLLNRKRVLIWWLLALSSIPLHLVYNSIFYSAIATNDYNVLYAASSFINGAAYDKTRFPDNSQCNITEIQSRILQFERLDNKDCIAAYSKDFVADRSNVIAIVRNVQNGTSLQNVIFNEFPEEITPRYNPYSWICDNPNIANETDTCCENQWGFIPCPIIAPKLEGYADHWVSSGFEIDYCLSQTVESACHLHFSSVLMGIVLFFNLIKVICMSYVVFRMRKQPIITVGDAIQSFILRSDPTTKSMCLTTQRDILKHFTQGYTPIPLRYESRRLRWYRVISWKQWSFLFALFAFVGLGTIVSLTLGVSHVKEDSSIQSPWSIGLGTIRPQNLIMGWNLPSLGYWAIAVSTLIANIPQALFSFIYVCYNSIFTNMLVAHEWSLFGTKRKQLRVSNAAGNQKSTYFLHMPYKYGVPLLIGSGLLHWLVSQSIFLANIAIIPRDGTVPMKDEITTCAFAPLGMLLVLMLCLFLIIFLAFTAFRKFPSAIPVVGTNSIAISAACHVPGVGQTEKEDIVLQPLAWGALPDKETLTGNIGGVGHCCFSDLRVHQPEFGRLYA